MTVLIIIIIFKCLTWLGKRRHTYFSLTSLGAHKVTDIFHFLQFNLSGMMYLYKSCYHFIELIDKKKQTNKQAAANILLLELTVSNSGRK